MGDKYQDYIFKAAANIRESKRLIFAAMKGQVSEVEKLLENGFHVNVTDKWQRTALHWVCSIRNYRLARLLCRQKGVEIDLPDYDGRTPLHDAAEWGAPSIVLLLLRQGAKTSVKDRQGRTPLQLALTSGQSNVVDVIEQWGEAKLPSARQQPGGGTTRRKVPTGQPRMKPPHDETIRQRPLRPQTADMTEFFDNPRRGQQRVVPLAKLKDKGPANVFSYHQGSEDWDAERFPFQRFPSFRRPQTLTAPPIRENEPNFPLMFNMPAGRGKAVNPKKGKEGRLALKCTRPRTADSVHNEWYHTVPGRVKEPVVRPTSKREFGQLQTLAYY